MHQKPEPCEQLLLPTCLIGSFHPSVSVTQDSPFSPELRRWGGGKETKQAPLPLSGPWRLRTPPCLDSEEIPHSAANHCQLSFPPGARIPLWALKPTTIIIYFIGIKRK